MSDLLTEGDECPKCDYVYIVGEPAPCPLCRIAELEAKGLDLLERLIAEQHKVQRLREALGDQNAVVGQLSGAMGAAQGDMIGMLSDENEQLKAEVQRLRDVVDAARHANERRIAHGRDAEAENNLHDALAALDMTEQPNAQEGNKP